MRRYCVCLLTLCLLVFACAFCDNAHAATKPYFSGVSISKTSMDEYDEASLKGTVYSGDSYYLRRIQVSVFTTADFQHGYEYDSVEFDYSQKKTSYKLSNMDEIGVETYKCANCGSRHSVNPGGKLYVIVYVGTYNRSNGTQGEGCSLAQDPYEPLEINITDSVICSLSPTSKTVSSSKTSFTLNISCNTSWELDRDDNWVSLSKSSGTGNSSVTVTVAANNTTSKRVTYIYLDSSSGKWDEIEITQSGGTPTPASISGFSLSSTSITDTGRFYLNGDVSSGTYYLRAIRVSVFLNEEMTHGYISEEKTFSFSSKTTSYDLNDFDYIYASDAKVVTCTGCNKVHTEIPSKLYVVVYVGVYDSNGNTDYSGGYSNATSPKIVNVTSTAITGSLSPTSKSVPASKTSFTLSVSSNTSWVLDKDVSWITLSKTSGTGNGSVTVTVAKNSATSTRTAYIALVSSIGKELDGISITQSGGTPTPASISGLSLSSTSITDTGRFYLEGEVSSGTYYLRSIRVSVFMNEEMTHGYVNEEKSFSFSSRTTSFDLEELDYIYASDAKAVKCTGCNKVHTEIPSKLYVVVYVGVYDSDGDADYAGGCSNVKSPKIVNVTSTAVTGTLSPTSKAVAASKTSFTLSITSNTSWVLDKDASWITLSKASGTGNSSVTVTAAANSATSTRNAYIALVSSTGKELDGISITQSGATPTAASFSGLSLSTTSVADTGRFYLVGEVSSGTYYLRSIRVSVFMNEEMTHGYVNEEKSFSFSSRTTSFDLEDLDYIYASDAKAVKCTGCNKVHTEIPSKLYVVVYVGVYDSNGDADYAGGCSNVKSPKIVSVTSSKTYVSGITLNKSSISLTVGETYTLTPTISPSNATNKTVTWMSTNSSVITVSTSGVVTAKAKGTATITCNTVDGSGKSAMCRVTVSPEEPKFNNVILSSSTLSFGKPVAISGMVTTQYQRVTRIQYTIKPQNSSHIITSFACGFGYADHKMDGSNCDLSYLIQLEDIVVYHCKAAACNHRMETITTGKLDIIIDVTMDDGLTYSQKKVLTINAGNVLMLPKHLSSIEDEAFYGSAASVIICPDGMRSIGRYAFKNCQRLKYIYIPASVSNIPSNAFANDNDVIICTTYGSAAYDFANNKGLKCVLVE